ncbi:putative ETSous factor-like 8, partial [Homarus americanus]
MALLRDKGGNSYDITQLEQRSKQSTPAAASSTTTNNNLLHYHQQQPPPLPPATTSSTTTSNNLLHYHQQQPPPLPPATTSSTTTSNNLLHYHQQQPPPLPPATTSSTTTSNNLLHYHQQQPPQLPPATTSSTTTSNMMDLYSNIQVDGTFVFGDNTNELYDSDSFLFPEMDGYGLPLSPSLSSSSSSLTPLSPASQEGVCNVCFKWAESVCYRNGIDLQQVDLSVFLAVTGRELSMYSQFDFCKYFGSLYGGVFFEEMRQLFVQPGIASGTPSYEYEDATSPSSDSYSNFDGDFSEKNVTPELSRLKVTEEDFTVMDDFLHQEQNWDLLQLETQQQYHVEGRESIAPTYNENYTHYSTPVSAPISCPITVPELKIEEPMIFDDSSSEAASSPDAVVPSFSPSCNALKKIRTKSRKRDKDYNPSYIRWEDRENNTFRFVIPGAVANMWGRGQRPTSLTIISPVVLDCLMTEESSSKLGLLFILTATLLTAAQRQLTTAMLTDVLVLLPTEMLTPALKLLTAATPDAVLHQTPPEEQHQQTQHLFVLEMENHVHQ